MMGPDEMRRASAARFGSREALVARTEPFRAMVYIVTGELTARTDDQREGHPAGLGAGSAVVTL